MPDWVCAGFSEYEKRLPKEWKPYIHELAVAKRAKNNSVAKLIETEGESILAQLSKETYVIALDVLGRSLDTPGLAKKMASWQLEGRPVAILIGGPDGLSQACLARANERWSLSGLTLPHPLVRIVLIEQLYRGWTILQNHPYHK